MSLTLVTDDASREDIAETLRLLLIDARHCPNVIEPSTIKGPPTKWSIAHSRIDDALSIWESTQ